MGHGSAVRPLRLQAQDHEIRSRANHRSDTSHGETRSRSGGSSPRVSEMAATSGFLNRCPCRQACSCSNGDERDPKEAQESDRQPPDKA